MMAAEVAATLGNARREGRGWRCICPVHGGHSLTLRDGRDRRLLVKCWAGCDRREVFAELRRLHVLGGAATHFVANDLSGDRRDRERRQALARRIWDSARDARGTSVERYLASRGITMPPPPSLRWASSLRRPDATNAPAMVARVDSLDGELIGVHRTWLDRGPDGALRRRDRASFGPIAGGAVRLAQAGETLLIGEGLETCMATMQATGLPGWAALSTSGMTALRLPREVRHVVILADNDANGAGQRAAHAAAQRWLAEGLRVRIAMPPELGTDMADVLRMGAEETSDAA
jgi:phage/plasmid primase-like uncharacterized protein